MKRKNIFSCIPKTENILIVAAVILLPLCSLTNLLVGHINNVLYPRLCIWAHADDFPEPAHLARTITLSLAIKCSHNSFWSYSSTTLTLFVIRFSGILNSNF